MTEQTATDELTLEYSLFDLPSIQHKAGLAGLCLLTESLRRLKIEPRPEITFGTDAAQTTVVKLTPESLRNVFNHFFAAITKNDGKKDKVLPAAKFLETLGMPEPWINLWRSVIANVLRAGAPAQFKQFRDRADPQKADGITDWQACYDELIADGSDALSGSDAVGVESKNAERVQFKDASRLKFLLTFWPVVSVPFRSSVLKPESNVSAYRFQFDSYLFVTPEVASLEDFVSEFPEFLSEDLDPKTIGESTWPIASSVSCRAEGGLRFFAPRQIVSDTTRRFPLMDLVSTVEIAQIKYGKGSPSILAIQSLELESGLLNDYENIRDDCWNPLWRARRIENLLNDHPWHTEAIADFNAWPWELFVHKLGATPKRIPFFGLDLVRRFRGIEAGLSALTESDRMDPSVADDQLALRIYRLMRNFVNRRTEEKSELNYKAYAKADAGGRKRYRDALESVARDAFLQMRGRNDDDFVAYFAGSICAVPHFLKEDDYVAISNALLTQPGRVKTLSMLALSAHSYLKADDKDSNS